MGLQNFLSADGVTIAGSSAHGIFAIATLALLLVVALREWRIRKRLATEIATRIQAEQTLQRRERYLKALAEVSQLLLDWPAYLKAYEGILRLLGEASGASRVYIFQNHRDENGRLLTSQRAEWCAAGITPQIDNPDLQGMVFAESACRHWLPLLEQGKPVAGRVTELSAEERKLLESQDIRSILILPLMVKGALFGFIGFDQCDRERLWEDSEIYLLHSAAHTLSQYIERQQAMTEVAQQRLQLKAFFDCLPGFAFLKDTEGVYRMVNREFCAELGLGEEAIIGRTDHDLFPPAVAGKYRDDDLQVIRTGQVLAIEEGIGYGQNEGPIVSTRKVPLRDADGMIIGVVALCVDITERKNAETEVQRLNVDLEERVARRTEQLQQLNDELEAFCYTVSHDLRGPLTGIRGFCQLVLDDLQNHEGQACAYITRVLDITDRTSQLIDDLLTLSRSARVELVCSPVDLSSMVETVAAELQLQEQHRQVTFSIAEGVQVVGDENLLRIVIQNLLGNAWKYSSRQPAAEIRFGTLQTEGETLCYVSDNGAGFKSDYADRLFQAFTRLHTSHDFPGTGIGLAIVSRIIKRHGGRVWAEGEEGRGATFYFTLPGTKESFSSFPFK
jgi:PAS domain S-box-containing protein